MSDPIDADDDAAPQRQGIQSVELAMQVVRALEEGRGPRTLSQLAQACGMSTSKVHRYLVSLIRSGLVSQSQRTGLYDFGPAARRIGIEALRRVDEVALATEYLPSLRDRTTHSVNLAVWGDNGPVLVHWEYGEHALPMNIRIGSTLPLLDSSVGQVFLAYLPEAMTRSAIVDAASAGESAVAAMAHAERIRAAVRERRASVTSGTPGRRRNGGRHRTRTARHHGGDHRGAGRHHRRTHSRHTPRLTSQHGPRHPPRRPLRHTDARAGDGACCRDAREHSA